MKIIIGMMMFVLLGIGAMAQTPKVIAELVSSSDKTIKNSPFSAEAVSESVQVLADGNRIVRSSTSKLFRNSEGRFRRELAGAADGQIGLFHTYGAGITILDPVGGYRYMLDTNLKTARALHLKMLPEIAIKSKMNDAQKALLEKKLKTAGQFRLKVEGGTASPALAMPMPPMAVSIPAMPGMPPVPFATTSQANYESRTEELGSHDFEGVMADGKRTVTTIPADAIGNERPIEIAYERWYSKELELVVYSKHSDPRFGDQTYKLTNLVRSEPDPSLFTLPDGYKLLTEPAAVYKLNSVDAYRKTIELHKKVTTVKPAPAPTTVTKP